MNFQEKIDKLLVDNNIKNLRQLAQEIDIPYTTLWDYYSNPKRLEKANILYIKKIAQRLNCTIDYLVYNDIIKTNEIKLSGYDLDIGGTLDENNDYLTKFKAIGSQEQIDMITSFLDKNEISYEKNVVNINKENTYKDLNVLYDKVKKQNILNNSEKDVINAVITNAINRYENSKKEQ